MSGKKRGEAVFSRSEAVVLWMFIALSVGIETLLAMRSLDSPRSAFLAIYAAQLIVAVTLSTMVLWDRLGVERSRVDRRSAVRFMTICVCALFSCATGSGGLVGPHLLEVDLLQIRWALLLDFIGY